MKARPKRGEVPARNGRRHLGEAILAHREISGWYREEQGPSRIQRDVRGRAWLFTEEEQSIRCEGSSKKVRLHRRDVGHVIDRVVPGQEPARPVCQPTKAPPQSPRRPVDDTEPRG